MLSFSSVALLLLAVVVSSSVVEGRAHYSTADVKLNNNKAIAAPANETLYGTTPNFGRTANGIGDLNGDNYPDIAFAATQASEYSSSNASTVAGGAIFILWGSSSAAWPDVSLLPDAALGLIIRGSNDFQRIGYALNGGCDVNHDGVDDLIIGASSSDLSPAVYILYGRPTADWASSPVVHLDDGSMNGTHGGFKIIGRPSTESTMTDWSLYFGHKTPRCIGDFNSDGHQEILLGDQYANSGRGLAVLVMGRSSWPAVLELNQSSTEEDGRGITMFMTNARGSKLGMAVAGVDLNLDGHLDIVVTAPGAGDSNRGHIYVIWGGSNQAGSLPATVLLPPDNTTVGCYFTGPMVSISSSATFQMGGRLGIAVAVGDVNGDSHADLVFTAQISQTTTVVFASKTASCSSTTAGSVTFTNQISGENGGASLATGDYNNDGFDDVIIGAPRAASWTGKVYIWYGNSAMADLTITNSSVPDGYTWSRITGDLKQGMLGWTVGVSKHSSTTTLLTGALNAPYGKGVGYIVDSSSCQTFSSSDSSKCESCALGYGLNTTDGTCVECSGMTWSNGLVQCAVCPVSSACLECDHNTGVCLHCSPAFGLKTGDCTQCTGNQWSDGTKPCQTGPANCLSCDHVNGSKCNTCHVAYGLQQGSCSTSCAEVNGWSSGLFPCVSCSAGTGGKQCVQCAPDTGKCTQCSSETYFIDGASGVCTQHVEITLEVPEGQSVNVTQLANEVAAVLGLNTSVVTVTVQQNPTVTTQWIAVVIIPDTSVNPVQTLTTATTAIVTTPTSSSILRYVTKVVALVNETPVDGSWLDAPPSAVVFCLLVAFISLVLF